MALFKTLMIYLSPPRAQRPQSLETFSISPRGVFFYFLFSAAFAFSVFMCPAVKFKDIAISLENSAVAFLLLFLSWKSV
nr:hypothetical protein GZ9C4_12 [uncultured archaeon GZfos9C4]